MSFFLDFLTLEDGTNRLSHNIQSTLCDTPEEQISHLQCGGSLYSQLKSSSKVRMCLELAAISGLDFVLSLLCFIVKIHVGLLQMATV